MAAKKPISKVMDVDEFFSGNRPGPRCWRSRLNPKQLAFFKELEEAMKIHGTTPNWAKVSDRMRDIGPGITPNTLARHYKNQCLCARKDSDG